MPDWILLLPIGFPAIGALILVPLIARVNSAARQWLALGFLAAEIALLLVNIAPGSHRLVLSNWELAAFTLALQMDGITQLLLLTMFIPLVALWLIAPPSRVDPFALLIVSAAILLAAADGAIALLVAWTILDLALLAWRLTREIERATALRSLAIGLLSGLIFFAGAITLTARPADGALLIALALWARLGLFPFHPLLPSRGADEFDLWFARGIPLIAAANLWLHWSAFQVAAPYTLIGILASANSIVAAFWIWRAPDATRALSVGAQHAFALVPLSIAFGGEAGVACALWQTLAIAFALALGEIAQRWRAENRNYYPRLVWFLALLALAGLPLTPAFLGRIGLYVALTETGEWFFLALAFATTLIIFAPLWNWALTLRGSELREPTRVEYAGLVVVLLPFAALAFAPLLLAPALGIHTSAERALDRVIRTNNVLGVLIGAVVLILPIIGVYFVRARAENRPGARSFIARLSRVGDLEWLERAAIRWGSRIGALTRGAFTITEENPTVWILLAGLWIAIFIAVAR
ncbi:MAG: hypothetical protein L0Y55_07580 [Anaerolineales bacterium]|nr:hypothetical protein [Anaerolineales bacterium]